MKLSRLPGILQNARNSCRRGQFLFLYGGIWQNAEKFSDSALERTIAGRLNELPKVVISRSKVDLMWKNSQQIIVKDNASLALEMENLKKKAGGNMSVESGVKTWQLFIQNALFDDIWMFVHPVVVSQGEKLFADVGTQFSLHLSNSKIYNNGVVGLYYQKNRPLEFSPAMM